MILKKKKKESSTKIAKLSYAICPSLLKYMDKWKWKKKVGHFFVPLLNQKFLVWKEKDRPIHKDGEIRGIKSVNATIQNIT